MSAKDVKSAIEAPTKILTDVITLANAVKVTLGPNSRNVGINKSFVAVRVTKKTGLEDKFENMATSPAWMSATIGRAFIACPTGIAAEYQPLWQVILLRRILPGAEIRGWTRC